MKSASESYTFGPFEFDPAQQELRSSGDRVTLPAALNKLLLLFVRRPGMLITRDDIAQALWDDHGTIDIENGINGAVRRLRSQLSAGQQNSGSSDNYIQTVVGTGYRFIAQVTVAYPEIIPSEPAHRTPHDEEPGTAAQLGQDEPTGTSWNKAALAACLLLAIACIVGFAVWKRSSAAAGVNTPTTALPSVAFAWAPVTYKELEDELSAQAISPSGDLVASADRAGLSLQKLHSKETRQLALPEGLQVGHLSWFADERRLLASGTRQGGSKAAQRSEAWVISLAGESPSMLLDEAAFATVSPDGQRVAYSRAGRSEIWVADADGQQTRRLVGAKAGDTFPCLLWSSRSDRLVVSRDSTSALGPTDAEKGALDQLQHQHQSAYESYDAKTGKLLARQANLHFDSGFLLPDGRFLYPVHVDGGDLKLGVAQTNPATGAILAIAGSLTLADLGMGSLSASGFTVARDGKTISAILERPSADVYVGDLRWPSHASVPILANTQRFTRRTGTNYPTAWSPDRNSLILDVGDAGRSVIARQAVGDDHVQVIADIGGRAVLGQFTPDGQWIFFLHYVGKPSRVQSVDRVRASGGASETLYASANIVDYRCSRSAIGRCVLRETVGNRELIYYALDAATGRGRELARTSWQPNVLGDWSLSPDGTTVAMANHDPVHPGFTLIKLAGTSPSTAAAVTIPVNGFGTVLCPTWAVSGKGVFVQVHSESTYALVYVTLEGQTTLFLKSPMPIWAVESRDGKKLAFPGRTPLNRNVWSGTLQ